MAQRQQSGYRKDALLTPGEARTLLGAETFARVVRDGLIAPVHLRSGEGNRRFPASCVMALADDR
jgi:hypothetical protein